MSMNGKILKDAVRNSGIKIEEIVAKSGIPKRTLYNLFEKDSVEAHYVENLEKAGVKIAQSAIDYKPVPYYDIDASAGTTTIFAEDGVEFIKQYLSVPAFADCDMFINVSGDSMYPRYQAGDLIALKKINDFEVVPFNEAYLVVTKEQRLLKFIRKARDRDHWLLCSENQIFEPFEVPIKKVLHLYIVKGKIKKDII